MLDINIVIVIGIFGLIIGSFLNVVIYRVPLGQSIVTPGSHCTACGHQIKAWENIPIISFLVLKGKCRSCQAIISWRYPTVELLTGVLFYLTATVGLSSNFHLVRIALNLFFVSVLIALAYIDLDTFRLPDVLTLPLLGVGLLGALVVPGNPDFLESALCALGAGGVFWIIARVYPQGMGLGDVKLVAAMGALLGFPSIFLAIFIGSFIGAFVGILFLLMGKKGLKQQIPFGPYLAMGALIALLWGTEIFNWYWMWAV